MTLDDESSTPKDKAPASQGKATPKITKKTAVIGAAVGIGSAAIVAALLYTNRSNKS